MNDVNDNGTSAKAIKRINDKMRETQRLTTAFDVQHASRLMHHVEAISQSLAASVNSAKALRSFDQHQIASVARVTEMISKSLTDTTIGIQINRALNSPIHQAMAKLDSEQLKLHQPVLQQLKELKEALRLYEERFTGPDASLVARQVAKLNAHPLSHLTISHQTADHNSQAFLKAIADASSHRHLIEDGIKQLRSNWIDIDNPEGSVRAFARITDLNATVRGYQSFVPDIAENLRTYLGDWRDTISFPEKANEDIIIRTAIYEEQGVDVSLTDFPDPAFVEILDATGLADPIEDLEEEFGPEYDAALSGQSKSDLDRTNYAHRRITIMEISLRRFINYYMTLAFGPDWPKRQLPKGMLEKWVSKQEKAKEAGQAQSMLINYADFTEYPLIICKRDNFSQVFEPFFSRPEYVRETFQRLHFIRLDTMHGRLIDMEGELFMFAETLRIFNAIRQKR